jgi:adenylosuccinate synthase
MSVGGYADVEPIYEEMPGWRESTVGITDYEALPGNARRYLERLERLVDVPLDMISTGPDREQTIVLRHPFGA